MESVIRALVVYAILLIATRLSGRRTLGKMTPFDFVLLLIVAETVQEALLGDDHSITHAIVLLATLFLTDVVLSYLKRSSRTLEVLLEGMPTVLMSEGKLDEKALGESRVDLSEILEAGRERGLKSLAEIDSAVLEINGEISIIPVKRPAHPAGDVLPPKQEREP